MRLKVMVNRRANPRELTYNERLDRFFGVALGQPFMTFVVEGTLGGCDPSGLMPRLW